jgi:hypothetical protein
MDKNDIEGVSLAVGLFLTTALAIYSFSTFNINVNNFLTFNIAPLIKTLFSTNGLIFFILCGLPIAIILYIGKKFDYYKALFFSETGYGLAMLIGIFLFKLTEWAIPLIFVIFGIAWSIKFLKLKESELKSKLKFSAGQGAANKIVLSALIGFIIVISLTASTQAKQLEENFVPELLAVSIGDSDSLQESVNNSAITLSIESQKSVINSITNLESYQTLLEKNDPDVITFLLQTETLKNKINAEGYADTVKESVGQQNNGTDIIQQIIQGLPIMNFVKYIWIMYTIMAFVLFQIIGNVIVKNIAAGYYAIMKILFDKLYLQNDSQ